MRTMLVAVLAVHAQPDDAVAKEIKLLEGTWIVKGNHVCTFTCIRPNSRSRK